MNKKIIIASVAFLAIAIAIVPSSDVNAQSKTYGGFVSGDEGKTIPTTELGMLICENAEGEKQICSGSLEETVLGIVTNTPYVTLNKPKMPEGSKYVFEARVSDVNGPITRGDYLKAVNDGALGKCGKDELPSAYAVALESSRGSGTLKVKVLRK